MLTPRFRISQDVDRIFISIHAPFAYVRQTEVDVDGKNVLFVSSPYFLRLSLPGSIAEDENSKGNYVCDTGEFHFTFTKVVPGENFENLDMITNLLSPRDIPDVNPSLVQALEEDGITLDTDSTSPCDDTVNFCYGFGNKIDKEFTNIGSEFPQIFDLQSPENVSLDKRHELRIKSENDTFSSDHYLADYFDDELLKPFMSYEPFWDCNNYDCDGEFTMEQVNILKELPNKHYLLTETEYKGILLGLIDILFGYCYDKRTTLNDSNVESSWTINKLSSTLSWFCNFKDVKQVLISSYRRALIYPIYRNFELCHMVTKDLISLLQKGKRFTVKCLIEIHQMFNTSTDARYILNQLYINDYLVFLQKCRREEINELCQNILNYISIDDVKKDDLEMDLKELEHAAELVQEEESDLTNGISSRMALMSVNERAQVNGVSDDETETDSDSSEESTSDDSSTSDSSSSDDSSDLDSDDTESEKSYMFLRT